MPRGDYRQTIRCADRPCRETITYHHETRRDEAASIKDQQARPWKCSRHSKPSEVLGPERQAITSVMTVIPRPNAARWETPLIWAGPGFPFLSDSVRGVGFQAFAGDWPEGTRLEITARILPPCRPRTPEVRNPDGSRLMTIQRCCNGCGDELGDATDRELECAVSGESLPDVRSECPACREASGTPPQEGN